MKNININGAKNAGLPILAATLLQKNLYYIKNIPLITDINVQLNILKQFNVKVSCINKKNLFIDTTDLIIPKIIDYTKNTRGTYYFIGSTVIYDIDLEYILETGCKIDVRSIDFHVTLLELLGKKVTINENKLIVNGFCINRDITYTFPKPSIGATINAIFMYSQSKSIVTLKNYAKDPYIINTINLLKKMGICIDYNDNFIIIHGNNNKKIENRLIEHTIIEDPIEALTYIIYSGINIKEYTTTEYTIGPINIYNLGDAYSLLESIGIFLIESRRKGLYHIKKTKLSSFNISTGYFPKIYTDIQPFLALLSLFIDNGITTIKEEIWNDRFKYICEFNKFGYKIVQNGNTIIIDHSSHKEINQQKPKYYENKEFNCTDLRGGMALLLLMRKNNVKKDPNKKNYIDRGYHDYENNIKIILHSDSHDYYKSNFNTKKLSNINIGGISKYYTEVFSQIDIIETIKYCKNNDILYKFIGDGNNIYFSEYYDGMIIKNMYSSIYYNADEEFIVYSGTSLIDFILYVAEKGYDLSNLAGIPGTIGGAIYGNAGAYGLEIKDIIISCLIIKNNTDIITMDVKDINFEYRTSIFKKENKVNRIILSAKIKMNPSNICIDEIKCRIKDKIMLRNKKFQIENTLGSVFKNITINNQKIYAWELIDEINLRGVTINNITINNEHPNIFINNGLASPSDLNTLIEHICHDILKNKNIILEKEIEYINSQYLGNETK